MIIELTTASSSVLSGIRTTLGAVGLSAQETIRGEKTFIDTALLSSLFVSDSLNTQTFGNALQWYLAYTLVNSNSAYWNQGGELNYGTLQHLLSTSLTTLSTARVLGNLTVFGALCALSGVDIVTTKVENVTASTFGLNITGEVSFSGGSVLSGGQNLYDIFTPLSIFNISDEYIKEILSVVTANSASWINSNTTVSSNSASWQNTYTQFSTNSSSYLNLTNTNSRYARLSTSNTFTDVMTIDVNSSAPALRVAQIGSGDVFRAEDTTSPDLTPFVITSAGRVGIGTGEPITDLDVLGSLGSGNIRASGTITTSQLSTAQLTADQYIQTDYFVSNSIQTNNLTAVGDEALFNTNVTINSSTLIQNFGTNPTLSLQQNNNQTAVRVVGPQSNTTFAIESSGRTVIGGSTPSSELLTVNGGISARLGIFAKDTGSNVWDTFTYGAVVTSNFIARPGVRYIVNTQVSPITATLVTNPPQGSIVYFEDLNNYWGLNTLTVVATGIDEESENILIGNSDEPLICDVPEAAFHLLYINSLSGWKVKAKFN